MTPYEELLEDLQGEHEALGRVLERLPEEAWDRPTHAPGWTVRDQVSHLAGIDETATRAILDPVAFRAEVSAAREGGRVGEPEYLTAGRRMTAKELLDWWRRASAALVAAARGLDPKARMPWFGPDMSGISFVTARLMETWSHGLDVVDVVDFERPATDRIRHVVFLGIRTRSFSYANRGLTPNEEPVFVRLQAPSGATWTYGEPHAANTINGAAEDFAAVVTRRRHWADTGLIVEGDAAREWMDLAQAFAGPPGEGRQPGQFPRNP